VTSAHNMNHWPIKLYGHTLYTVWLILNKQMII